MRKFALTVALLAVVLASRAQTWEIGGGLGANGYIGDINPNNPFYFNKAAGEVFVKRNFNGYISARLNYGFGSITGADSTSRNQQQYNRNLSFTTPLKELSLLAEFNFFKYIPDAGKNKYTPYVFAGIGTTSFDPKADYRGETFDLRPLRTEGQATEYRRQTISIPYGAGFKYNIGGKWTVAAELSYHHTFTDYLDDVSTSYPVRSTLTDPRSVVFTDRSGERLGYNIGSPGSQRGDARAKDIFMFVGFTLTYTFVTARCYYED